ncbi:MAG: AbrB/MazE/SpoVT family DNA-binding domain-containing protein [Candidatus Methanodesulfokora sp.]|jgi:AbrB family looped-hinge helix DNA binding protein|nr:MAG: AbrB family transcriptional regulator [Candidatus Korarchaeota archaeon]
MGLTVVARIGKKRTLVIPKRIAEELGIREGDRVRMTLIGDKLVLEPEYDAVWLSLHGKKVAKIYLKELESESIEQQRKHIESAD